MTARAPVHTRLRQVATIRPSNVDKKGLPDETRVRLCNYTDVYYNDEILDDAEFMVATATPDQVTSFTLRAGDVLITKDSESPDDIGVPAYVPEDLEGVLCGYHLSLVRPNRTRIHPKFLFWALKSAAARSSMSAAALGITRFALRSIEVANLEVPLPEMNAQIQTADFLDRETARVDSLIDRRLSLHQLLWLRWESEVYRAVTEGVSSTKGTRLSGLKWVGEIPSHWATPPVYANFDVQLGKMLNPERAAGPSPAPYLRNVNVQWDRIDLDDLGTMSFDEVDRVKYALRPGDLLVCEGGEVGRAAVWQGGLLECFYQKAVHRVRPRGDANARFLMYCLWAAASMNVFNVEGNQATIVHLTAEKLREHRFPMPPRREQDAIVAYLDERQDLVLALGSRIGRHVELLRERREALITAAVMGKMDVTSVGLVPGERSQGAGRTPL